jgi:hypothetical protein
LELVDEVSGALKTSSTGARLTFIPARFRFLPAPVPASRASVTPLVLSPTRFSDSWGAPGRRRTSPPSWSTSISNGARTGLDLRTF